MCDSGMTLRELQQWDHRPHARGAFERCLVVRDYELARSGETQPSRASDVTSGDNYAEPSHLIHNENIYSPVYIDRKSVV